MGDTILVSRKNKKTEEIDDWDHTLFMEVADELDRLAESLSVTKPSEFFDWTDYRFNMSDEELPESWIGENQEWHRPSVAIVSLRAIIARLEQGGVGGIEEGIREGLIEELRDCLKKIEATEEDNDLFHFCIVM